jgi:pimeloyl-ACP methyl ester carboxylesterase
MENQTQTPKIWQWKGYNITYQSLGLEGEAVVLIHGFGASWQHWRKNLPFLGQFSRCYAIDLIGFGGSDKPTPNVDINYTFETWALQIADFCKEIVGSPAFLVGNSIGCVAVMQTAVTYPEVVKEIALINCSLRLLHERKRNSLPFYKNFGAFLMQNILTYKPIGYWFFQKLAKKKVVKNILLQAYYNQETVTDELIDILMKPAQDKGAADVFLAFTAYSQGALPEDLLPILPCSAIILWGDKDPWEDIKLGQEYGKFSTVKEFIPLKNVGHCPQDEAPELVNPILQRWIINSQF